MIELMQKGGPLMWVILLCSIFGVGLFLERLLFLHRASIDVPEFLRGLANLIRRKNFAEARHECAVMPVPVGRVLHSAILRHDTTRADLKDIVQEAGQLEVPGLERNLAALSTVALVTPLIGLLGTVTGLIQAFITISANGGYASAADISGAIYQSLLTTAAGLSVAIPAFVGHQFLSGKVNRILHDIERAGIEIVNLLTDEAGADQGIIRFDSAGQEQTFKS